MTLGIWLESEWLVVLSRLRSGAGDDRSPVLDSLGLLQSGFDSTILACLPPGLERTYFGVVTGGRVTCRPTPNNVKPVCS